MSDAVFYLTPAVASEMVPQIQARYASATKRMNFYTKCDLKTSPLTDQAWPVLP